MLHIASCQAGLLWNLKMPPILELEARALYAKKRAPLSGALLSAENPLPPNLLYGLWSLELELFAANTVDTVTLQMVFFSWSCQLVKMVFVRAPL